MSPSVGLIVAPYKFDVLKTSMFAFKAELLGQIYNVQFADYSSNPCDL